MPWQEMSKRLRELAETGSELASIIGSEYSDIKTRLDNLEEQMGRVSPNWLCSESEASQHDSIDHYYGVTNFEKECHFSQEYIGSWLPGNSGFEQAEEHRLEREPWDKPEETTGTHPPNCHCAWCEPMPTMEWMTRDAEH